VTLAALESVFHALNAARVRYLVAGGVAVNAHGYQRLTHDLDLFVHLDADNLTTSLRALAGLGYRPVLPVRAEDFADPSLRQEWVEVRHLQVFSLASDRRHGVTVDLFATAPFDFNTEYEAAMEAEVAPELFVRFVRLATLIEMKEKAGRPRDLDDAEHLRRIREEVERNG
jgi:hypothetical protein